MATATVKDGVLTITVPFQAEGKVTASKKNILHATTELGTPDALFVNVGTKKVFVQVNAYSVREIKEAPKAK